MVDVLQKAELLIAGGEREISACGEPAAPLSAEGWVGEDECGLWECLTFWRKCVAVADTGSLGIGIKPVQHQIHEREPVYILHVLHTVEGVPLILVSLCLGPAARVAVLE